MGRSWWLKTTLVLFLIGVSGIYLLPTFFDLHSFPSWAQKVLPNQKLQLGLDLQGGLHIVMGIDPEKVLREHSDLLADQLKEDLKAKVKEGLEITRDKEGATILVKFSNRDDVKLIRKVIQGYGSYNYKVFEILSQRENELTVGFGKDERQFVLKRALEQSIEAIRNRVDEFGVSEPSIQAEGTERIVVQLPGIQDVERAKELIGRTAKLEFKLVDASKSQMELTALVKKVETEKGIKFESGTGQKFSVYLSEIRKALEKQIPEDSEISFEKSKDPQTGKITWLPYLLKRKVDVTGNFIQDARWNRDPQTSEPIVEMSFSSEGAKRFAKLTEENVGKPLAIVLDDIVHSAPRIDEKIPNGRARISFRSSDDPNKILKDAQDTALVLRAGALPTTIELQEERTVGPSLGADSIAKGTKAIILAFALVVLFMMIYYKWSGVIANFALLLNLLFLLAMMAIFGSTLTLPGLAGIVLTIGMAVDANVLIFERIREEIRLNKSPKTVIETGFEKAWSTILDSNLTTIMAALALLSEGTGPIKGFAVTLTIGICVSMFTAVFVSKLFFELLLQKVKILKVSI